jgi:hypothetical protein
MKLGDSLEKPLMLPSLISLRCGNGILHINKEKRSIIRRPLLLVLWIDSIYKRHIRDSLNRKLDMAFYCWPYFLFSDYHYVQKNAIWKKTRYLKRSSGSRTFLLEIFGWKTCRTSLKRFDFIIDDRSLDALISADHLNNKRDLWVDIDEKFLFSSREKARESLPFKELKPLGFSEASTMVGLDGVYDALTGPLCIIEDYRKERNG